MEKVGVIVKIEDIIIQGHLQRSTVKIPYVKTSTPKYVRLCSIKKPGKGRRVNQENHGKSV